MPTHFETFINAFSEVGMRSRELDGDFVLCPPHEDFGYSSTPRNALTFAAMGVDGVHFAILKIHNAVRDDSPVVQVSPMDSADVVVLAETFLKYLAYGCQISVQKMETLFEAERAGEHQLVQFLSEHFERSWLFDEDRIRKLTAQSSHLIDRKIR